MEEPMFFCFSQPSWLLRWLRVAPTWTWQTRPVAERCLVLAFAVAARSATLELAHSTRCQALSLLACPMLAPRSAHVNQSRIDGR